ncbi:uncharacterized protein LOC112016667 [Quercus suber]|uniref:uncharacterized protein LOC112016667 n=1 Tax=Quercus suber TaxID=58331 RepID=UPI0032DE98FD
MVVHSKNEALMCKVFPSSLGPVAMRWFNGLRTNSIDSYRQLTQAFGSRFVTNSRPPRPMNALLSLSMRDGETLKAYSDKYWEIYNELDGKYDAVAISTFQNGLPIGHGLKKSLTGKSATSVRQLMDRIDKYKRMEEDMLQGKGKEKVIPQERRDFRSDRYSNARPRRDFGGQSGATNAQTVGAVFREPIHKVLERIKNEPYFRWPIKMIGEPDRRNQNRYCQYHQDHGHATEDCRNLWNHLDQLVRDGRLKHLLHHSSGQQGQTYQEPRKDAAMGQPAGTINIILAAPGRTGTPPLRVLSVAQLPTEDLRTGSKRSRRNLPPALSFSEEDKIGTIQPHEDALIITLRIGGYDVKRVMVDGGSAAEVMCPDFYKGLGLKPEDLTPYSSPLMSFDGKLIIPKGIIRLPIQTGPVVVEVNFVVVDTYSPYTAIVGRPWLHALGGVASTLHQKVKFPSGDQVLEIRGCQPTARQCTVAAISYRLDAQPSAPAAEDS